MLNYDWHFDRLIAYREAFAVGIGNTILLSLALISFSTLLGVGLGVLLRRAHWWNRPAIVVIDILKGLPPLVIILFGYYLLSPQIIGISVPAFWTFTISLGLNVAAFIADLTRAGLTNVPPEYAEMGQALGLRNFELNRFIILPMAVREIIPPLSYLYVEAIKLTSLASVISVNETVYKAGAVIQDLGRSIEVWIVVGLIYLMLVSPTMLFARILERHFKKEIGISSIPGPTRYGYG